VPGGLNAEGNLGVLQSTQQTPYSIGYLGVSLHAEITEAGLGTALIKSYSGEFLLPTPETVAAAAASLSPSTPPDERSTLVNAPGANAYPLVNLRLRDRLDQAGGPGDCRGHQKIPAVGNRAG
jgi:phosphate transport system substrate-binding protein